MIPEQARAILLLPAGHRAFDEDFTVTYPLPDFIEVAGGRHERYLLAHIHHAGRVDQETRALYILGGEYLPQGATLRLFPDEACDQ